MNGSNVVDGKYIASLIRAEVKAELEQLQAVNEGVKCKLAVVLVGNRPDSASYVSMKEKACEECGIDSQKICLPESISQEELQSIVASLNADDSVDGILVQLPLPPHIHDRTIIDLIDASKDVDGLHPFNVGNLALKDRKPLFKPCTAEGCVELCRRIGLNMKGANVVVVGRSNIVGMPVALLFQQEDATVTMCHSKTMDLDQKCRNADIIIAAIGSALFIKQDWVKDGAVVIDVGINAMQDSTTKKGYRLVGDVDFEGCKPKCKFITPVPGGMGPMTVAMLIRNTFEARKRKVGCTSV